MTTTTTTTTEGTMISETTIREAIRHAHFHAAEAKDERARTEATWAVEDACAYFCADERADALGRALDSMRISVGPTHTDYVRFAAVAAQVAA